MRRLLDRGSFLRQAQGMKASTLFAAGKLLFPVLLLSALATPRAGAEWQKDGVSVAWRDGSNVVWRFSFDPSKGKTFFDPLNVNGRALTNFKPEDHPWHYGLWFSWKYINKANYWEENRQTGKAEGVTRWTTPDIETKSDGSATMKFNVSYTNPSGQVDMTEKRELKVTAVKADGSYTIDWRADFVAGKEGAVLDRTPMPGEPKGAVNGGYAGLGLRMASAPLTFSALCSTGAVNQFVSDRARPFAPAVAFNFGSEGRDAGGIAIFSDPANAGENAPWYIVNSKEMRFACAAILAPKVLTLKPGEELKLRYRIAVSPKAWTVDRLRE